MMRLVEKVVLITGAFGGIGSATVERFLQEGAKVVATDINVSEPSALLEEAVGDHRALVLRCDAGDSEQVQAAISQTVAIFGRLDVLCGLAGGSTAQDSRVTDAPEAEFWRAVRLDLFGTFILGKYGLPHLIEAGGGSFITMSSMVALQGVRGRDCYTAAKGGVGSLTRSMAHEYGQYKIRVNAIAPGMTITARTKHFADTNPDVQALLQKMVLAAAEPVDIANIAVYLASDESRATTGQVYAVDSGITTTV